MSETTQAPESNLNVGFDLTPEEKAQLSKVLFPDTHSDEVTLLGKKRKVRPLPIKYSKMLKAALDPIAEKLSSAIGIRPDSEDLQVDEGTLKSAVADDELISALHEAAVVLADFYQWKDVKEAAQTEELTITELQDLAVRQQEVCGANDFLLGSLRFVINLLRMAEVFHLKFRNMLFSQDSATPSSVASTT